MAKPREYTLSSEQLITIQKTMKQDQRAAVRQRAHALHLLHLGHGVTAVAEMLAVQRRTIYNWHDAWLAGGIAGLVPGRRGGRKPKATPAYCELLEKTIESEPAALGFDFAIWTIERLRTYLAQKTDIELSARAFSDLLQREGYVYRRPKHNLKHLQDAQAVEQAQAQLEALKKRPNKGPLSSSLWTKLRSL